ncbi:MAG: peroxidase family protein, partial [Burkholderiales bacterium]
MASLIKHDLEFILKQILIAEAHPDGSRTYEARTTDPTKVPTLMLPWGLRTVTGIHNNLVAGQEQFGAADTLFPRLAPAQYKNEGDDSFDANGPTQPGGLITNNNYNSGGGAPVNNTDPFVVTGDVADADPRIISNLISDQSMNNKAAISAWQRVNNTTAMPDADSIDLIQALSPDVGLSPSFNSWFTLFGQFFDHGLDLVTKGGSGTVYIPLQPDDPLRTLGPDGIAGNGDEVPASRAFMMVTRATQMNAARDTENTTTSFVDQNQTYTSHPSHQAFLREYTLVGDATPVSTGRLLNGAIGTMPTWGELKTHIAQTLGFRLADTDVGNAPLLATDAYGNLLLSEAGRAQLVLGLGADGKLGGLGADADTYLKGDPAANGGTGVVIPVTAMRTGHAFLNDISHPAGPFFDHDRNPNTGAIPATPDANLVAGDPLASTAPGQYDNELLDAHYITGDGRGNENIGLTTVHHIFHSEHNRQVELIKESIIAEFNANGASPVVAGYLSPGANLVDGIIQDSDFDGARLFQAARFATEMQYQHLVFEEFARKIMPGLNPFPVAVSTAYQVEVDPSVVAEFAHVVYRFGHSMLTNTVDRINPDGTSSPISLIDAFLDPVEFARTGAVAGATGAGVADAAAGAIVRGMTQQVGNEIDEFVVDALRTNLLGLPLDLGAINIARGRDTGVPSLNSARRTFYESTNLEASLKPYDSWEEFGLALRNPESLVNFIAAYGTHPSVTSAATLETKRNAAYLLVNGHSDLNGDGIRDLAPVDRAEFMNSSGAWAQVNGLATSGLEAVDFWMGGLAELPALFGNMLGSTFSFVFDITLLQLQNADRFYYLSRTAGLNFVHELEANSFSELIMKNTTGVGHLPGDSFSSPNYTFEAVNLGQFGSIPNDPATPFDESTMLRRTPDGTIVYIGQEHVVLGGTEGNDRLAGGPGIDTLWGDGGNDHLEGGADSDELIGGEGNDILTDAFGDDVLKGGAGHDVLSGGPGLDLLLAGTGNDFVLSGNNATTIFGGGGADILLGGTSNNMMSGNEGDDWLEGGDGNDLLQGDNGDPFQMSSVIGNDVFIGGGGSDDYDTESGDDLMVAGPGIERNEGMLGFDWVTYFGDTSNGAGVGHEAEMTLTGLLPPTVEDSRDRFDLVEGVSGGNFNDVLRGSNFNNAVDGLVGHELVKISLIGGLQGLLNGMLGGNQTLFDAGNILLGGDGNDLFEGRYGDELIDGNKYLNVRLAWIDPSGNIQRFTDSAMDPALQTALLNGTIDSSQVKIVREILSANGAGDINTAQFNQSAANYTIIRNNARGTTTVTDNAPLTAGLAPAGLPLGPIDEGTDTLRNIQRLMFIRDTNADGVQDVGGDGSPLWDTVTIAPFDNNAAAGVLNINDTTPTQGQTLSTLRNLVTDAQTINQASVKISWQAATNTNGPWTTVLSNSPTFVPGNAQVGQFLRAVMDFEDGRGFVEQRISNASAAVTNINDAPSGASASVSATEDTARTFAASDFGFTDPDGGTLSAVRIDAMSLPAGSSLTAGGNAVTAGQIITAANLGTLSFTPALNATGENHASFSFSVRDAQNAFDPAPNTLRINVTPVNDAPNGTSKTIGMQEDSAYVFTAADFGFTDVDADDAMRSVQINNSPAGLKYNGVQVTSVATSGPVILIDNLFPGRLVYTAAPDVTGPAVASFTFAVWDLWNAADPTPATMTIGVTPTNDAAAGQPTISDTTPTRGAAISASVATIIDTDGVVAGSFTYQWQSVPSGSTSWTPIAGATVATFTP